jgi:hypothetical protein
MNGVQVQTVNGVKWLTILLQRGHAVSIGIGQCNSGAAVTLPNDQENMLSIATPTDHVGHHPRGVASCAFINLNPNLSYTDNNNWWSGPVNWMVAYWK